MLESKNVAARVGNGGP